VGGEAGYRKEGKKTDIRKLSFGLDWGYPIGGYQGKGAGATLLRGRCPRGKWPFIDSIARYGLEEQSFYKRGKYEEKGT